LVDPEMPEQEPKLHMGELTAQEVRTARAAIQWASSQRPETRFFNVYYENGTAWFELYPTKERANNCARKARVPCIALQTAPGWKAWDCGPAA
jgi:hypothetical protein